MSLNRVLSRSLLAKKYAGSLNTTMGNIGKRNVYVSTPPMNKISTSEKFLFAAILTISITFIPAWVMFHVPEYQGERKKPAAE